MKPPQDFMTYRPTKLINYLHPLSNSESLLFSDVGWVAVLFHSSSIRVKMSFTHVQTAELRWESLTDFVDSKYGCLLVNCYRLFFGTFQKKFQITIRVSNNYCVMRATYFYGLEIKLQQTLF